MSYRYLEYFLPGHLGVGVSLGEVGGLLQQRGGVLHLVDGHRHVLAQTSPLSIPFSIALIQIIL